LNSPAELDTRIRGQEVLAARRHGKILIVDLSRDALLIHLKMSGRLVLARGGDAPDPYAHVVFGLAGGDELRFRDPRKFGRVWLVSGPETVTGGLGPDALDPDLTERAFTDRLRARRGRLKPLLLNQAFVAGVGNIYADETLWWSRLHPLGEAAALRPVERARLYGAMRQVLAEGVAARGATITTGGYRDLGGAAGGMAARLEVFRRTGEPCRRCGATVARIVVGARSTHFCPGCQKR
jgi:formamidopyrimidine-DNA glycosylase